MKMPGHKGPGRRSPAHVAAGLNDGAPRPSRRFSQQDASDRPVPALWPCSTTGGHRETQEATLSAVFRPVEPQDCDRRPPGRRPALQGQVVARPGEVIAPTLATRVEKLNLRARERVHSARMGTLADDVALVARDREVVRVIGRTILRRGLQPGCSGRDVVDGKRPTPHATVLAPGSRSSHDEAPGRRRNHRGSGATAVTNGNARAHAPRRRGGAFVRETAEL